MGSPTLHEQDMYRIAITVGDIHVLLGIRISIHSTACHIVMWVNDHDHVMYCMRAMYSCPLDPPSSSNLSS